jgi:hypothetical protein
VSALGNISRAASSNPSTNTGGGQRVSHFDANHQPDLLHWVGRDNYAVIMVSPSFIVKEFKEMKLLSTI